MFGFRGWQVNLEAELTAIEVRVFRNEMCFVLN
jgi:hypothetical protein